MAYEKFGVADNALWNIDADIWASTLTINLWTWEGALFPDWQQFIWTLVQYVTPADPTSWVAKSEKVLVTAKAWDILTITRWYDWDTATTFDVWDYFYLNMVAEIIKDIQDEVTRLETDKLNLWSLRTWLTNIWKMFFSDWDNNEAEITIWTIWQVLTSNWENVAPSFESPSVDINALDEDEVWDITEDFFVKNNWTWLNKKIKISNYMASDEIVATWTDETKFVNSKQLKASKSILVPGNTILWTVSPSADWSWAVYTWTVFGYVRLEIYYNNISNWYNTYWSFWASILVDWVSVLSAPNSPWDSWTASLTIPIFIGTVITYSLTSFNNTFNDVSFSVKWDTWYIN